MQKQYASPRQYKCDCEICQVFFATPRKLNRIRRVSVLGPRTQDRRQCKSEKIMINMLRASLSAKAGFVKLFLHIRAIMCDPVDVFGGDEKIRDNLGKCEKKA